MSVVNGSSFEDAAARYVGLHKLGQAFQKPEGTVIADFARNPVACAANRIVSPILFYVVQTESFSICDRNITNPLNSIYSLTQRLALYCTPGKTRGIAILKFSQKLLKKPLPSLERGAQNDRTKLIQILYFLVRDLEHTAGDSVKLLSTWGTFVPLIQKLEKLAHDELVEPLKQSVSEKLEQTRKEYEARCYQYSEYDSGYFSAIGTAFTNTAKRAANGAFAIRNQAEQLGVRAQPLATSGAVMAGSQLLQYKAEHFERDTKREVVNKVVDASTKLFISLALQFFVVSRFLEALSSHKPGEQMTYPQLASHLVRMIYFPVLFLFYAYGVHCWRKERLKSSQQVVAEIALAQENKIQLARTVANIAQGVSGVSDESIAKFTTKAIDLMNQHVEQTNSN